MRFLTYFGLWLISEGVFYNIATCESSFKDTGFNLFQWPYTYIVSATNIGLSDKNAPDTFCCKNPFKYFKQANCLLSLIKKKNELIIKEDFKVNRADERNRSKVFCRKECLLLVHTPISTIDSSNTPMKASETILVPVRDKTDVSGDNKDVPSFGRDFLSIALLAKLNVHKRDIGGKDIKDKDATPVPKKAIHNIEAPIQNPINDLKPIKRELTHDIPTLNQVDAINTIRSVQKKSYHNRRVQIERSDFRKPVRTEATHNMKDSIFAMIWPFQKEGTHNIASIFQKATYNMIKSVHDDTAYGKRKRIQRQQDGRKNTETKIRWPHLRDRKRSKRNSVTLKESEDLQWPIELNNLRDMRRPVIVEASRDMRKPVSAEVSRNTRKPVIGEESRDLRLPVTRKESRDLRSPVTREESRDLRSPVTREDSLDLRSLKTGEETRDQRLPVSNEKSRDLRLPVTGEEQRDLRWPVHEDESRDLRWPVIEEESRDLRQSAKNEETSDFRNPQNDIDIFRNSVEHNKISEMVNAYEIVEANRNDYIAKKYSPKNATYDPFLKCREEHFYKNESVKTQIKNHRMKSEYRDLWSNAFTVCDTPPEKQTEAVSQKKMEISPWLVSVSEYFFGSYWHKCGAFQLNSMWVITAAHCVDMKPKWEFALGFFNQGMKPEGEPPGFVEMPVDQIVIHPKFNKGNFEHDIALLRMEYPVEFQYTKSPICLPWNKVELEGRKALILGWKLASQNINSSDFLGEETVAAATRRECEIMFSRERHKENLRNSFFCKEMKDYPPNACGGDSGSPLVILDNDGRWSLVGLVSWCNTCTSSKNLGAFIRISSYGQWMKDVIDCYESFL